MFDWLIDLDKTLFVLLNNCYCSTFDPVMIFVTGNFSWIPLYLVIFFFFFRKHGWKTGLLALLAVLLIFGLTDQLGVHLFKNTIQRLRPCHESEFQGVIRILEACGGQYSFISNHAANTFGLATFTSLFFRKKWYVWSIVLWAALVSYSRIYVGKHYPLDLLCGAIFGALIAYLVYRLYTFLNKKIAV
ncbi:MAG: phosphatase PAP2 family protein [Prevotellaceae bacterium]|jgi:undecaprenyl-diphosphatase|nr:phosphatase PAP2 family protein [Prevotellaceae bacterium]